MSNTIEKLQMGPVLAFLVVGILLSSILFYTMFKYADEGNLFMVILIPLVISAIAFGIGMSIVPGSKE